MSNAIGPKNPLVTHSTQPPAASESVESKQAQTPSKADHPSSANQEAMNKATQQHGKESASWQNLAGTLRNQNLNAQLDGKAPEAGKKAAVKNTEDENLLTMQATVKHMDKEIETQIKRIKELEGQVSKGDPKTKKAAEKSLDVETQKLQRMVQKRSQMFEMLGRVIDRYNEQAKKTIDSLGR